VSGAACPRCGAPSYEAIVHTCPFCDVAGCTECLCQGDALNSRTCCAKGEQADDETHAQLVAEARGR